jgi:hypothetical protein
VTTRWQFRPDASFALYVKVRISETRKEMLRVANGEFSADGSPIEKDERVAGLSHPTCTREFSSEGNGRWSSDHFVTVYLNVEDMRKMRAEVVAHEGLHAAMTYERKVNRFCMDYGDGSDMEHEERLAYAHGRIVVGLYDALAKDRRERMKRRPKGRGRKNGRA